MLTTRLIETVSRDDGTWIKNEGQHRKTFGLMESSGLKGGSVSDFCCFHSDVIMALRDPSFPSPKSISLNSVVKMETTFVSHNSLSLWAVFIARSLKGGGSQANKKVIKTAKMRTPAHSNMFQICKWIKNTMCSVCACDPRYVLFSICWDAFEK